MNYTVAMAVKDYMAWFKIHRKSYERTLCAIKAHILPDIGHILVDQITALDIRKWHEALVFKPKRSRAKNNPLQTLELGHDEEALRKRKATANRILNILKAVLNKAFYDGKVTKHDEWNNVRPFRKVDAPRSEYLEIHEIKPLINAAPKDLAILIQGALHTGCRYGELAKMTVKDFNLNTRQLFVKPSKNGKSRYVILSNEAALFFQNICASQKPHDLIFTQRNGSPWSRSVYQRPLKHAVEQAGIHKHITFHTLRHTYASQLAMGGVSLQIIARQLGHYDTRITEKHYAHLSPNYMADIIRNNTPSLGIQSL